jgi:hypothetical protein
MKQKRYEQKQKLVRAQGQEFKIIDAMETLRHQTEKPVLSVKIK